MAFVNNSSHPIQTLLSRELHFLDALFPSFSPISHAILRLLTGDLDLYTRLLCVCSALVLIGSHAPRFVLSWLETHFSLKVQVLFGDEAHEMVLSWVSSQTFAKSAHSLLASVDGTNPRLAYGMKRVAHVGDGDFNKKPLHYAPWNGSFYFWHKGYLFEFRRVELRQPSHYRDEEVTIRCFSRSPRVLRGFLDECRCHYLGLVRNKTSIFENQAGNWKPSKPMEKRQISTVIIDQKLKDEVIEDCVRFLDPGTRRWYSKRGIPYRRGYLFHGPPGTGKSSLSISLAGKVDLDVYILNLADVDNKDLKNLFASLPQQCIVLLEDVDAVSLNRSEDIDTKSGGNNYPPKSGQGKVSLSTLLNVLDGVGSPEGRILIMTTNHLEHLDNALIRPGRADLKIEFRLADKKMIANLFCYVFSKGEDRDAGQSERDDSNERPLGKTEDNGRIELLAKQFATKVPERKFSPAEVMSLLLANKQSPQQAVDNAETWVTKIMSEKKNKEGFLGGK